MSEGDPEKNFYAFGIEERVIVQAAYTYKTNRLEQDGTPLENVDRYFLDICSHRLPEAVTVDFGGRENDRAYLKDFIATLSEFAASPVEEFTPTFKEMFMHLLFTLHPKRDTTIRDRALRRGAMRLADVGATTGMNNLEEIEFLKEFLETATGEDFKKKVI